ncbi:MAG: response regulator [Desulfuromonadales bacterium]|nr:response regulator [Desulfuromonadales bacterium]
MQTLKRILLAEDDPNDVELTMRALATYKLANAVHVVGDGAEALDYLFRRNAYADRPAGHPVVVLLDIKMPRVDGIEVLRQIKADPDLHVIPVVILTSSREERDVIESYRLGVNAFVVKPVDFHGFVDAVKEVGLFWAMINEAPPTVWTHDDQLSQRGK